MHALVVSELFSPTRGGTAVWFDQVYRNPLAAGSEIVAADLPDCREFDASYPRPIHRVGWERNPWLRPESGAVYARLLWKVAGLVKSGRFQAVHAGRVLPEGLTSILAGWAHKVPVLIYAHGEEITGWQETIKSAAMRWTYRRASAVIANSAFTRDRLIDLGVRRDRIAVLHPGVDVRRFRPDLDGSRVRGELGIGDEPLILSVGRLQARKGFDRVIAALRMLERDLPSIQHAVIGVGEDGARLRRLAFEHNVADRVHFVGRIPDEELPEWYAACDVFAMPNRDIAGDTEGFGLVYLEAGACGKCVLAGKDGGTGSAVLDAVTGLQVDGHSTAAVAGGLRRLLLDRNLAETLARQGLSRIHRDLTWQAVVKRTVRLHQALTASCAGEAMPADGPRESTSLTGLTT